MSAAAFDLDIASDPSGLPALRPAGSAVARLRCPPKAGRSSVASTPKLVSTTSDDALLNAVICGDPRAWRAFLERFRPLLLGVIHRTSRRLGARIQPAEVDDLLQEISLRLLARNCARLRRYRSDPDHSVANWVAVIGDSTTRDFLRSSRRRVRVFAEAEFELEALPSSVPNAEAQLHSVERLKQLRSDLESLPPREREFAQLYFVEGRSPKNVAALMQISVGTVYSRSSKILARLQGRHGPG